MAGRAPFLVGEGEGVLPLLVDGPDGQHLRPVAPGVVGVVADRPRGQCVTVEGDLALDGDRLLPAPTAGKGAQGQGQKEDGTDPPRGPQVHQQCSTQGTMRPDSENAAQEIEPLINQCLYIPDVDELRVREE